MYMNMNMYMDVNYSCNQCGHDRQIESELSHECETSKNQAEGLCVCFISCKLPRVPSQSQAEKEKRVNTSVQCFSLAVLIFGCLRANRIKMLLFKC